VTGNGRIEKGRDASHRVDQLVTFTAVFEELERGDFPTDSHENFFLDYCEPESEFWHSQRFDQLALSA